MATRRKASPPLPAQSPLTAVTPADTPPLAQIAMSELGASGLKQYSGVLAEEELRELSGTNGQKRYREMQLDPVVRGCLRAIELLCRRTPWHEEPGGLNPEDEEAAKFLGEIREDMSHTWADFIGESLTMLVYGWSYAETIYKVRSGSNPDPRLRSRFTDGRIGVRKLAFRSQDSMVRWEFDDDGGIKGLWQRPAPRYDLKFIPIEKALLFRTTTAKGNPEGESCLRGAFTSWFRKRRIENIEAIGIERNLNGIPVAWVPPSLLQASASSADAALLDTIKKIVTNIRMDEQAGLVYPLAYDANGNKLYDIGLLAVSGKRDIDTSEVVKRYDLGIALSMLADVLLIGHEKVGSYSLASSKTNLFASAIGAFLDAIQEVLNRHLVPRLFELNGWDLEKLPQWKHGDIESADLAELSAFLETISRAGAEIFPNFDLTQHLLTLAGLPALPDDHEDERPSEDAEIVDDKLTVVPSNDPAKAIAASPDANVQETGLNGAQVTALLEIVREVAANKLPGPAAQALIGAAFPLLEPAQIARLLAGVQGFAPEMQPVNPVPDKFSNAA